MENINNMEPSEKKAPKKMFKRKIDRRIATGGLLLLLAAAIGGFAYWQNSSNHVYIEKGEIYAPKIDLSSENGGILENVLVKEGEKIVRNQPVAQIGNEVVRSREDGLVVNVRDEVGKNFSKGEAVVSIIKTTELRVLGTIEEDKGLSEIRVGQRVVFTADAFGSEKFQGFVEEVSPSAKSKGLAFSISDKRAKSEFVIKARFNADQYPQLKNGMSAKLWVYRK